MANVGRYPDLGATGTRSGTRNTNEKQWGENTLSLLDTKQGETILSITEAELFAADKTTIKLYLRNTQDNGLSRAGAALYDLLTTQGTANDDAVVTTTAAGTEIQFTKTAGGTAVAFISPRFDGTYLVDGAELAAWFYESVATVNASARFRFYRWRAGVEVEFTGSPFDKGGEFGVVPTYAQWVAGLYPIEFLEDDRLLVVPYVINAGTMDAGTATLNFNSGSPLGSISVATVTDTGTGTVDLTALSASGGDYHIFDVGSALNVGQRKAGGGSTITVAEYDPSNNYTPDSEAKSRTASATDATPTTTFSDNDVCRVFNASALTEGGFEITLPASTEQRRTKIFVMAYNESSTAADRFSLVVSLSDGSVAPVTVNKGVNITGNDYYYTIDVTYRAANDGATCTIIWKFASEVSAVIRTVQYLAAWVSAGVAQPVQASSIILQPSITFKPETGGFDATNTEAATAAATQSAITERNATNTEAATASATQASTTSENSGQTEAATAAATQSTTVVRNATNTEAATAGATQSNIETANATNTEPATANATQSNAAVKVATSTEASNAASTQSALRDLIAAQTEGAAALDQQFTIATPVNVSLTETSNAQASQAAALTCAATQIETGSLAAAMQAFKTVIAVINNAASAQATQAGATIENATITNSANAVSSQSASLVKAVSILEVANANAVISASAVLFASITEALAAIDYSDAASVVFSLVSETVTASDMVLNNVPIIVNATITETGFAADIVFRDDKEYDANYLVSKPATNYTVSVQADFTVSKPAGKYTVTRN